MVDGGGITLDYLVCRTFINVLNYAHNTLNTPLAIAQRLPTPTTPGPTLPYYPRPSHLYYYYFI